MILVSAIVMLVVLLGILALIIYGVLKALTESGGSNSSAGSSDPEAFASQFEDLEVSLWYSRYKEEKRLGLRDD
jgi:hypothetical protein